MSNKISRDKIIKAVLDGIIEAHNNYETWTGGNTLNQAPEYLVTCCIANKIGNIDGKKYLYLENNTKASMDEAGSISCGRYHNSIRTDGRIDILLHYGSDKPRAIIEVKSPVYGISQCSSDIERINEILKINKNNNSFQFGIFAFYMSFSNGDRKDGEKRIIDRYNNLIKSIDKKYSFRSHKKVFQEIDYSWLSGCIIFNKSGMV